MLSLDSDVIIGLLRGREPDLRGRFDQARLNGVTVAVSTVAIHELTTGAVSSQRPAHHLEALAELISSFEILDFTGDDAVRSAEIRAGLGAAGQTIGALDTLIAGQALARGLSVVTSNVRHFGRVSNLPVIDWSLSSDPLTIDQISARLV